MNKIELRYIISEAAQRTELAAGRPGQVERTIDLTHPALFAVATINDAGKAWLDYRSSTRVACSTSSDVCYVDHRCDRVLADEDDAANWLRSEDARCVAARTKLEAEVAERNASIAAAQAELRARKSEQALAYTVDDYLPSEHGDADLTQEALAHLYALRETRERSYEAKRVAKLEAEEARRAWVAENAEAKLFDAGLARAARENRDIETALDRRVTARVEVVLFGILGTSKAGFTAETYGAEERTDVPSDAAYALLDLLSSEATQSAIGRAAGLPNVKVEAGPINRYDVAPKGDPEWRTGVALTISHPWLVDGATSWSVLCEPKEVTDRSRTAISDD